MVGGQGRQAEHGAPGGDVGPLEEGLQLLMGIAKLHALSYEGQRPLGVVNKVGGTAHGIGIGLGIWNV